MHRDFVLCDIGWLDDGFYILLQQSNEKASVWLLLKDKEQEEMQYVLNDIQCLLSWHILKSKILPHLVVHPTLGALLEPEWAKDDPGDVDQLQGELLISWSRRYHSNTHNAKADDGEGAWLGAHAPAERLHHRHPDCLSKPLAHCNRKAV